jgi:hypothetical protein
MQSITINFKSSSKLIILFTTAALIALVIVLYLFFAAAIHNIAIILPLSLLIVFAASYTVLDQALMLLPWSVVGITIQADGIYVITRDQPKYPAIVLPTTTVNAYLTVVNLQRIDIETNSDVKNMMLRCRKCFKRLFFSKQHIIVMQDKCIDSQNFRRLRVWLRFAVIDYREHKKEL